MNITNLFNLRKNTPIKMGKLKLFWLYRRFQLWIYPKLIKKGHTTYIRIARLDNKGFDCKPYRDFKDDSTYSPIGRGICHAGNFINIEVTSQDFYLERLPGENVIYPFGIKEERDPHIHKRFVVGCFCFLYDFDISQAEPMEGRRVNLHFCSTAKLNIRYAKTTDTFWVRNKPVRHSQYVKNLTRTMINPSTGEEYEGEMPDSAKHYDWVKMKGTTALERLKHHMENTKTPAEIYSEIYIEKEQIESLRTLNQLLRTHKLDERTYKHGH